jgi:hypothetical protein
MLSDDMAKRLISMFGDRDISIDGMTLYAERTEDNLWWNDLYQPYERDYAEGERGLTLYAYLTFTGVARDDSDSAGQSRSWVRSNLRAIKAAYPNVFTPLHYSGSECLGAFLIDLDDDIGEMLIGLAEGYPLFDEDDVSALEQEDMDASWDQWAKQQFYGNMSDGAQDDWHAIGDERVEQLAWWLVHKGQEGRVSSMGYGSGEEGVSHDGLEVSWDFEPMMAPLAHAIRSTARKMRKRGLIR